MSVLDPTSSFLEQGFALLPGFFGEQELAAISGAFGRLELRAADFREPTTIGDTFFVVEPRPGGGVAIERIVWCGGVEPELGELGRSPKLLSVVSALLGSSEMDQLVNQAHIKNPGDGIAFAFHQDSYHRRYGTELFTDVNGRGSFVQALTAVDAMDPENGGLWVLPGSHHAGHVRTVDGKLPNGAFDLTRAVPMRLAPGDTLLLSPFTVHGSGPNRGSTPRRVFINGFACPGANRRDYPGAGRGHRVRRPEPSASVRPVPALLGPAA